jgi:hypothetical protein
MGPETLLRLPRFVADLWTMASSSVEKKKDIIGFC